MIFSTWRLKTSLYSTIKNFDTIFHLKAAENLVEEHCRIYIFDIIFNFMAAQNLVAEPYERDFDKIFLFKTAQNLIAEHYERI